MKSKIVEVEINATKDQIWDVLVDFENLSNWMPTIFESSIVNTKHIGLGTRYTSKSYRRINTEGGSSYRILNTSYEIIAWDKYQKILTNSDEGIAGLFKTFQNGWLLNPMGKTTLVSSVAYYEVKFGFLGSILNKLIVGAILNKALGEILSNLKYYIETGEKVPKPSWIPIDNSLEKDPVRASTANQTKDIYSSKTVTDNQYCKKCYSALNDQGKCNQCDQKW